LPCESWDLCSRHRETEPFFFSGLKTEKLCGAKQEEEKEEEEKAVEQEHARMKGFNEQQWKDWADETGVCTTEEWRLLNGPITKRGNALSCGPRC
jgi:hypothetical protein